MQRPFLADWSSNPMKAIAIILAVSAFLVACSTTPLDENGRMVRMISLEYAMQCTFLSTFEGKEVEVIGDGSSARLNGLNSIRNQIASKGGNAFTQPSSVTGMVTGTVKANGYTCDEFDLTAEYEHMRYALDGFGIEPESGSGSDDDPYV